MFMIVMVLIGCSSPFSAIITVTKVMESARSQYDAIYQQGLVSGEVEAKAQLAWSSYQKAATVAADALEASQTTGDQSGYKTALAVVKAAVNAFIDAITPVISGNQVTKLKRDANLASKL